MKSKGGFSQRGGGGGRRGLVGGGGRGGRGGRGEWRGGRDGGGGRRGGHGDGGEKRGGGRVRERDSNGASKRGRFTSISRITEFELPPDVKSAKITKDVSSSDDEEYEEPASAYNSLLETLQSTSDSFAKAYAQRQKEEQGDDDFSEGEEEETGSELEVGSDSEMEDNLAAEEDGEKVDAESDSLEDEHSGDSGPELSEWEEVDGDAIDESVAEEVPKESPDEDKIEEESDSERLESGANASTCADPLKLHIELELIGEEITKLVEGKAKFKTEVPAAGVPRGKWLTTMPTFPKVDQELRACGVKERLHKNWRERSGHNQYGDFQSEGEAQFFSLCNSYRDILITQRCGPKGNVASNQQHQTYMDAYILHIMNHVLKTRDIVNRNNENLQRQQIENGKRNNDFIDLPRDQGFTRPKVLIMLPMRSTALKFVKRLIELAPKSQKVDVEHKTRFFDDFGAEGDEDGEVEEGSSDKHEGKEEQESNGYKGGKPADHEALFGGNNDDHFRIGIKFTRKSIKLYSDFYSSDIIIASPIGLVTRISEAENAKKEAKLDVDFLSSIEIIVVDYVDVILMQNWQHVVTVFNHLNRIPTNQHGTDFMRIREWYLNGHSRHYRQTIIVSAFPDAGVNALFHRTCVNHAGKVKLKSEYPGVLSKVVLQVRQIYERFECDAITGVSDARFEYFTKQVYPRLQDNLQGGILLFTSSYLDFVRLRNFLKSQNSSFCLLGEYTKQSDISRGRSWFYHQKRRIMLYSERAHFYHRYKIRGIRDLFFYSLPEHAQFYSEISNLLEGVENPSCTALFSKFDNLQLERIVGSSRTQRMLRSENRTFMFC